MDLLKPSSVAAAYVAAIIVVGVTIVAQDGGRGRDQAQASATGITPRHEHGYAKLGNLFYLLGGRRIPAAASSTRRGDSGPKGPRLRWRSITSRQSPSRERSILSAR